MDTSPLGSWHWQTGRFCGTYEFYSWASVDPELDLNVCAHYPAKGAPPLADGIAVGPVGAFVMYQRKIHVIATKVSQENVALQWDAQCYLLHISVALTIWLIGMLWVAYVFWANNTVGQC